MDSDQLEKEEAKHEQPVLGAIPEAEKKEKPRLQKTEVFIVYLNIKIRKSR